MRRSFLNWSLSILVLGQFLAVPVRANVCNTRGEDACNCGSSGRAGALCPHAGCACRPPAGNCGAGATESELAEKHPAFKALQARMLADRRQAEGLTRLGSTPCVSGMASTYPCKDIDLLAFLPLNQLGGDPLGDGTNDIWGWTDPQSGKEYAILGMQSSTAFVDVSNPTAPVLMGNLPRHSGAACSIWRSLKVYSNAQTDMHRVFIASEAANHGLQVFDLTQLRTATPGSTFTETKWFGGTVSNPLRTVHTLAINPATGYLYASGTGSSSNCNGGIYMMDVRDPNGPTFVGCFSNDGYNHESQCVTYNGPDLDHQGDEICFASDIDTITIVDVTNKSNPVQLSRTGYTGAGYIHQTWLTEDQRYLLLDDELDEMNFGHNARTYIWDMSNLDAPVLMNRYTAAFPSIDHNQYIHGSYSYQSNYRSGVRILHIGDIAKGNLTESAFFDVWPSDDEPEFNGTWTNYPYFASGILIASSIEHGLFVLQPNLGATPTPQNTRTPTGTRTWTQTPGPTFTRTSTRTPTRTRTPTPTRTPSRTRTLSPTPKAPASSTQTPIVLDSPTATQTPFVKPTDTHTPPVGSTETETPIGSDTPSSTSTPTDFQTATVTETGVVDGTPTSTPPVQTLSAEGRGLTGLLVFLLVGTSLFHSWRRRSNVRS